MEIGATYRKTHRPLKKIFIDLTKVSKINIERFVKKK